MKMKAPLIVATFLLFAFIGIVVYEHFGPSKYIVLNFHQEVPLTIIERPAMRGTIYINDTLVVGSDIMLVENNSNISLLKEEHLGQSSQDGEYKKNVSRRLGNLPPPYQLYKKMNNDTVVVIKNQTDTLKYLLTYTINDLYPADTLTLNDLLRAIFTEGDKKK